MGHNNATFDQTSCSGLDLIYFYPPASAKSIRLPTCLTLLQLSAWTIRPNIAEATETSSMDTTLIPALAFQNGLSMADLL
ncbi:Heat shock protein [Venturia inaequalis]|nr:Heat shock protein [Venturia inaequalis]